MNILNKKLAINGGIPIRTKPWLDNFSIGEEEKVAALRCLDSGYLSLFEGSYTPDPPFSFTGGPEVQSLERDWCEYYNVKHSISMNSATSGLYAAIGALGIGYGDEVIVSPYTMTACALAPLIYGAIPVFADVELESGSLDTKSIEKCITPRTKCIIIVHQFGIPANMNAIMELSKKYNIKIIEDCAQAHGAKYNNQYVGTFGDIGIFSLNVNKTIQTGEGCVCTTNNDELCYRLQLIRNHGEAVVGPAGLDDITNIAGFNYRLTELQAAIAKEQLKKLNSLNKIRLDLVGELKEGLKDFPFLTIPPVREFAFATYYVFPIRFNKYKADLNRNEFIKAVNAEGILLYQGYTRPLYLQPVYQRKQLYKHGYPFTAKENSESKMDYSKGICPNAEQLHFEEMIINEHIRYPHTSEDIKDIIKAISKIMNN